MQVATTFLQRLRRNSRGFTRSVEFNFPMRVVTERLVAGFSTAAQGGPKHSALFSKIQRRINGVGSILPYADRVHLGRRFFTSAIQTLISDSAGWAGLGDMHKMFDRSCFRMQPGALNVGKEHRGCIQYTAPGMDASGNNYSRTSRACRPVLPIRCNRVIRIMRVSLQSVMNIRP